MLCLSGFELYSRWVPLILVQNDTLCRVFSGLVQTCQLPKGKKCEILNLELGEVVQRNG